MRRVGNALTRRKGVGVFGSASLRREGVRGFGFGIGCSGVIQMTRDGRRQVEIGRIGVGSVTVVTNTHIVFPDHEFYVVTEYDIQHQGYFFKSFV